MTKLPLSQADAPYEEAPLTIKFPPAASWEDSTCFLAERAPCSLEVICWDKHGGIHMYNNISHCHADPSLIYRG